MTKFVFDQLRDKPTAGGGPIATKPTYYHGVMFRSRLEARWAVFFDTLAIPWEYEPKRITLPSGLWYIPDFRLDGHIWAEVKPDGQSNLDAVVKCVSLASTTNEPCLLLFGQPKAKPYQCVRAGGNGFVDYSFGKHSLCIRAATVAATFGFLE